jgi:hypothetical protein
MNRYAWTSLTALLSCVSAWTAGCASGPAKAAAQDVWRPVVCYEARAAVERVRCGRPDADDPGLQAVSVDQAGDVALVHVRNGVPSSEVLLRHGAELTGLLLAGVDPAAPGEEIYVGGYARGDGREGTGGAVLQIVLPRGPKREPIVRRVYEGPAFVHSIERVEPQAKGDGTRLLVSTYAGEILALTPAPGAGPWPSRVLHSEPAGADPEAPKIKDAAFLRDPAGRAPHEALVAFKTGRLMLLDLDHPEAARVLLDEPGGLSRVTRDDTTGAYVTGYFGRVLHVHRAPDGFQIAAIEQEGTDSGLRGVVLGEFPAAGHMAHLALFGFHKLCRALVPRLGVLDPVTLYVDIERGHTIEAADLVPGNGADEILLGGYSKRVTLLVVDPAPVPAR